MTLTDKTGSPVSVVREDDAFAVMVDENVVGRTYFVDRDGQRVFFHTEVDAAHGGRGLSTIVIAEALVATRSEGLRIVPVCPTVARYVTAHPEFADVVDKPTREIMAWLRSTVET
ncbi:GNAT family N-acetyltransferase [Mycolicibacterium sediminis]|uniref:N-acetyltransferase n=1 Tax=Mycolicibacterium sediminis TaxID=1286180 RepID=A0A7I7QP97_9MYCO|nr:GNAT family N-acetyltransferase [Mycolicibacterium sediminis]BBY28193.1 N-acetyltransferase [Mycolicibacterium sediminis]